MPDRVVADPDLLRDTAQAVRTRLLEVDERDYDRAVTAFLVARANDFGHGDLTALTPLVVAALVEVERRNRADDLFAGDLTLLDRRDAAGVVEVELPDEWTQDLLRTVRAMPRDELLRAAATDVTQAARRLRDDVALVAGSWDGDGWGGARHGPDDLDAGARDGTRHGPDDVDAGARDSALARIRATWAALTAAGVQDDPALAGQVVDVLGPEGLVAIAALLTDMEAAAALPRVPGADIEGSPGPARTTGVDARDAAAALSWTRAAGVLLAEWTGAALGSTGDEQAAAMLDALPAPLGAALAAAGDWPSDVAAMAAVRAWDAPVGAGHDLAIPRALVPAGTWRAPTTSRDWAAVALASDETAAHAVLTVRTDILNGLVTAIDHPAAAAAVLAGLVEHPSRLWTERGDATGVAASGRALSALGEFRAPPGTRTVAAAGHRALQRAIGLHLGMASEGLVAGLEALRGTGGGTHGSTMDRMLATALAAAQADGGPPTGGSLDDDAAIARVVADADGPLLADVAATLARLARSTGTGSDGGQVELVAVATAVAERMAGMSALGAAELLDTVGPQAVADLTHAVVAADDIPTMVGLGTSVARGMAAMPPARARDLLEMLTFGDDRAGWSMVLLAGAERPPEALARLVLDMELRDRPMPRNEAVRRMLTELEGDWTLWSRGIYRPMLAAMGSTGVRRGHHLDGEPATTAKAPPSPLDLLDDPRIGIDPAGVPPGLSAALADELVARPATMVDALEGADTGRSAPAVRAFAMLAASGSGQRVAQAVTTHAMDEALAMVSSEMASGATLATPAGRKARRAVKGALHDAGTTIGKVAALVPGPGADVDTVAILGVVVTLLTSGVPFLGTGIAVGEDVMTVARAVEFRDIDTDDIDQRQSMVISEALVRLTASHQDRGTVLGDFGISVDAAGIMHGPDGAIIDVDAVERAHPQYAPFVAAATGLGTGITDGTNFWDSD